MHWFTDPIFNHFADFSGRASRQAYWMFVLFNIIFHIVLTIIGEAAGLEYVVTIYALAILIPSIAIGVRRLHDIGKSGWWILIALVPIIGFIVLLIFYLQKGDKSTNTYGPTPAGVSMETSFTPDLSDAPRPVQKNTNTSQSSAEDQQQ